MNIKICKGCYSVVPEMVKWLVVIILLIIVNIGGYYYCGCDLLYKILIIFFIIILLGYFLLSTYRGRLMVVFVQEAYEELRKVVWPTLRDSVNTTVIVTVVTVLMSLILWGLDSMLVRVVSFGLRL